MKRPLTRKDFYSVCVATLCALYLVILAEPGYAATASGGSNFPPSFESYGDADMKGVGAILAHRGAQAKGRPGVFDNYRLRIASVIRDYGMFDREQAPADSWKAHAT
ncbi:hypothetical protein [Ruegeria denitrificans]|nr:hypothetical protein [Ruegeria denitrificans]